MLKISFSRATRRIVLLASTLALVGTVSAQAEGVWNTSMDFNGQAVEATLTITKSADGTLTAVWAGQQGGAELSNVKFVDGKLTFVRKLIFGDREFEMAFEGNIEGNELSGQFLTEFGGMAINGTRAAAVEAVTEKPKPSLQGTWELTSVSQLGEIKRQLVIAADMSGVYGDDIKRPIQNLKLDGDKVTFDVSIAIQDQEMALSFAGKIENEKITGKYTIAGNEVADVTAVKVVVSPVAAMVGNWTVTTSTEQGDLPGTLIIKEDLSGTMGNEETSFPIRDLRFEEGYITFRLTIDMQGNEIQMEFWGNIGEDGALAGTFDIDGQVIADLYGDKKK